MLWSLCDNVTDIVKTFAAGAACNLMKVPCRKDGCLVATVFAELRKEDRADWNVHADAERIGPANDFQETLLRKLFAEDAVLG